MGLGSKYLLRSSHFSDQYKPASFCYITNQPTLQTWCATPISMEPVMQLLYTMHATSPALCQRTRPLLQSRAVSCAT